MDNSFLEDAAEVAAAYNDRALPYHQWRRRGTFFNDYLEVPATLSLLPESLTGQQVLDAGCGSGFYAWRLAHLGANVVAMDASDQMIAIAKREHASDRIDYRVGDISQTGLPDSTFDWILCNYVLENVANLDRLFAEFLRLVRPGGTLIFSVSHPLRSLASREEIDSKERWLLSDYFVGGTGVSNLGDVLVVKKYKRTISEYVKALISTGFRLERLVEAQPIEAGREWDPVNYEISMRLPQLLTVQAKKEY